MRGYAVVLLLSLLLVTRFADAVLASENPAFHSQARSRRQRPMVRRGRPPKFGRPARSIALTLPNDVIGSLTRIDGDLARAVVALVNREAAGATDSASSVVDLVRVSRNYHLIVVDQRCFRSLPACTLVPLTDRWAFLALAPGAGLQELELELVDQLEEASADAEDTRALKALRRALQKWRRDPSMNIQSRSIIFVEQNDRARPKPAVRHARLKAQGSRLNEGQKS